MLDAIGCLVLLTIVMLCVVHFDLGGLFSGDLAENHRGAELGAPADPSQAYSAARPEWYYLFLFQLLKYFPGSSEIIGAIVIPTVVVAILFALPLFGSWPLGHQISRGFVILLVVGAAVLTGVALYDDNYAWLGPNSGCSMRRSGRRRASSSTLRRRRSATPSEPFSSSTAAKRCPTARFPKCG